MAVGKIDEISSEMQVFSIETSKRYESNLQKALDYSLQMWGAITMVKFHLEVNKEIDALIYFPYANSKNRFLDNEQYREIILRHFPYSITYRVHNKKIRVINIIHTSQNPKIRAKKR